ncbi:hypothetical protein TPS_01115 [Trichinella pseudospiralis]
MVVYGWLCASEVGEQNGMINFTATVCHLHVPSKVTISELCVFACLPTPAKEYGSYRAKVDLSRTSVGNGIILSIIWAVCPLKWTRVDKTCRHFWILAETVHMT